MRLKRNCASEYVSSPNRTYVNCLLPHDSFGQGLEVMVKSIMKLEILFSGQLVGSILTFNIMQKITLHVFSNSNTCLSLGRLVFVPSKHVKVQQAVSFRWGAVNRGLN